MRNNGRLDSIATVVGVVVLAGSIGPSGYGATISGTVKGPDGPLKGVFVQAQDAKTHISTIVMSDNRGRYRVEKLSAGELKCTCGPPVIVPIQEAA